MTKIMLVEDDKSLREIYGVRLLAEGYDIVSAGDGEEALAMAIKERPQLIVSDVMMPKISGFDMLDILRSTTETKNIRVIMMTALGSDDQRDRGQTLGADRYLVKSQVGIEDVVRVVHEVLEDKPAAKSAAPQPAGGPAAPSAPQPAPRPAASAPAPQTPAPAPQPAPRPATPMPTPTPTSTTGSSIKTRVIQPLNDPNKQDVDFAQLIDKELANAPTAAQEKADVDKQLDQIAATPPPSPTPPPPQGDQITPNPPAGGPTTNEPDNKPTPPAAPTTQ